MLCARCKKRQAIVFISGMFGDGKMENAGLCLTCARELHIPQVDSILKQFMKQMEASGEDLETIENRLAELAGGDSPLARELGLFTDDDDDDEDEDDEFDFLDDDDDIFAGMDDDEEEEDAGKSEDEDTAEHKKALICNLSDLINEMMESEDSDSEDDESGSSDDDTDNDSDGVGSDGRESEEGSSDHTAEKKEPAGPFDHFFNGSFFQPGGAGYADDAKGRKNKKKKRSSGRKQKKYEHLETYCTNLTRKAKAGEIDRVIGRDREIERAVQILCRRQKNNPCLIGEPGVGKTAIAEGLALRIAEGCVPFRLADKQLYLLDLTALVAGTQFRGQFEDRIKKLIDEVKSMGNVILFIDEVHTLVGTGDSEGSLSAANILKPALSRGEVQVIGATTFTEYRKYIEKDTALERRFQPVKVDEPSVAEAIEVLRGIKDYYEEHHSVTFSDELIVRAVTLSERYINDRFLPDKAIDLLDEACACAALRNKPKEEFLKLKSELEDARTKMEWLSEKSDEDPAKADYQKIAELRTQMLRLENRIDQIRPIAERDDDVTEADLAKVIELWTGIPASRIEESEYKRLLNLSDRLREKIKGQDEAVELVSSAIRRSRVQISPRRRPASFIFVGPTGVGKTELVKVLAAELFDTPETLIRLDMSEFMEKHSVSRIIGSPPGYVGYDEAGQLTEKVRRKPYSVVLFDEIEKAHPDVLNILLQILDEGRINDAHGRTVSFENTVIVMTSNAGSNTNSASLGFAKTGGDIARDKAMKALSDFLRPEFLARVDEVVCFNPLTDENLADIARMMCQEYVPALAERGCELIVEEPVYGWLASRASGGKSAARDLRGIIRREIEDRIAQLLIERGTFSPCRIVAALSGDSIAVTAE